MVRGSFVFLGRSHVLKAGVAAAAIVLGGGAGFAQEVPLAGAAASTADAGQTAGALAPDSSGVGDIVVTARRVNENLQQIPISVGVVAPEALVSRNIAAFQDLKGAVVGLTTSRTGTTAGGYVAIRGASPVATPQPASDQGVGFFIDGVAIARSQGAGAPLVDIARVEVLRGPQGTLFGRNSSFGSINFITNTPKDKFEASGALETGRYDTFRGEAMVNVPLAEGLIARFAFRHEEFDGDVRNTNTSPGYIYPAPYGRVQPVRQFDKNNSEAYVAKLRFTGIDGLTVDYKYDREDLDQTPPSNQLIGFAPTSPLTGLLAGLFPFQAPGAVAQSFTRLSAINEDHAGEAKVRNDGHMLDATLTVTDQLDLRSITAYRRTKSEGKSDLDGAAWVVPFPFPLGPGVALAAGPLCVSCSVNNMDQHAISEEVQLLGKFENMDFTLGGYYFDEHARFQNTYSVFARPPFAPAVYQPTPGFTVPPLGTPGDQVLGNNGIYDNRSIAAYGHVDYTFSDAFDISAGLRYTWDNRRTNDLRSFGVGLGKYKDSRLTYDAAANFHIDQSKMLFAKYARGYTAGGVDSAIRFRPEVTDQVEAGFKGEFFDRMLRFNASAYYTWIKDRQSTVPNTSSGAACSPVLVAAGFTPGNCPVGLFVYNLPGTTKIKGFEVETTLVPARGLTLSANYSYNDPKFPTGERVRAPKQNFSFSAQYDFPAFPNEAYFTVRFDGDYRSKYFATGGNVDAVFVGTVPAALRGGLSNDAYVAALRDASISGDYWLINGRVALANMPLGDTGTRFELAAFVRNLNDTRAPYFTVNYGATFNAAFERPRTWGLRAAFRY